MYIYLYICVYSIHMYMRAQAPSRLFSPLRAPKSRSAAAAAGAGWESKSTQPPAVESWTDPQANPWESVCEERGGQMAAAEAQGAAAAYELNLYAYSPNRSLLTKPLCILNKPQMAAAEVRGAAAY